MNTLSKQRGLSLLELMIAGLIGLLLLLGASRMYISTQQSFRLTQAQSSLQENGRFGLDIISQDLRRVGSMGCLSDYAMLEQIGAIAQTAEQNAPLDIVVNDPNHFSFAYLQGTVANSIQVFHQPLGSSTVTPPLPPEFAALNPAPAAGTDILVVRGEFGRSVVLRTGMENATDPLDVGPNTFQQDDVLMISNCDRAAVFRVTNPDPENGTLEHTVAGNTMDTFGIIPKKYPKGSSITQLSTVVYYVAAGHNGDLSLFRNINGQAVSQEFLPYIENLRVLLGEDTNMAAGQDTISADRYVTADQVMAVIPPGANIVSVRVALLVRSPEVVHQQPVSRNYPLFAENVATNDRFKRQIYSSTVVLRNRALR